MPHITIQMVPGHSYDEKEEMAYGVQQFLSRTYQIDEQMISVSIEEVPKEEWAHMMSDVPDETLFVRPGY